MGVRRRGRTTVWKIHVPEDLAAEYELLFFNRARGRSEYGLKSQIIEKLLRNHLARIKSEAGVELV